MSDADKTLLMINISVILISLFIYFFVWLLTTLSFSLNKEDFISNNGDYNIWVKNTFFSFVKFIIFTLIIINFVFYPIYTLIFVLSTIILVFLKRNSKAIIKKNLKKYKYENVGQEIKMTHEEEIAKLSAELTKLENVLNKYGEDILAEIKPYENRKDFFLKEVDFINKELSLKFANNNLEYLKQENQSLSVEINETYNKINELEQKNQNLKNQIIFNENEKSMINDLLLENKVLKKEIEKLKTKIILKNVHKEIDLNISKTIETKFNVIHIKKSLVKMGFGAKEIEINIEKVIASLNALEFKSIKEKEDYIFAETIKLLNN